MTADHHDDHHHPHPSPERRLLRLLRPDRRDIFIVVVFAVAVGILSLAVPIVVMAVVNSVAIVNVGQQLIFLCAMLFVALGFSGILQLIQRIVVEYIQRRVFVRLATDMAHRLPRVERQAFDRQHGPELLNRFFDVITVQKAAATLLLDGIAIVLQILIGLMLLGYYGNLLLGFDLILIASLIFMFTLLGIGGKRTAIRESIAKFAVAGWMEELARHPIAFKMSGGTDYAHGRTDVLTRDYLDARADHFRILMRQFAFAVFLQAAANVGLLAVGGYLVIQKRLTLGELVAAEIVVTMVVATFTKLIKQIESWYDLIAGIDKLGYLLDLPLERGGGVEHEPKGGGAEVALHDVGFGYARTDRRVLHHVTHHIRAGERVAITGANGVGKSTLMEVLYGLRTPEQGWVEIDGHDLRELRLDTLRLHVALVKGIEIFEGSVLDNVSMGRHDVTVADVREALRKVGLLTTIMELAYGLDTTLWTGGNPLSTGQSNRLMIARAIVGKPQLLLLDEALDNMDGDIRETVLPAIFGDECAWTLLIVTHSNDVAGLCHRTIKLARPAGE